MTEDNEDSFLAPAMPSVCPTTCPCAIWGKKELKNILECPHGPGLQCLILTSAHIPSAKVGQGPCVDARGTWVSSSKWGMIGSQTWGAP